MVFLIHVPCVQRLLYALYFELKILFHFPGITSTLKYDDNCGQYKYVEQIISWKNLLFNCNCRKKEIVNLLSVEAGFAFFNVYRFD